ncbi:hypothetical protein GCM10010360_22730 [Streptomyces nogalater]
MGGAVYGLATRKRREFMREWVTPLHEALAVPLGMSELTDPRRAVPKSDGHGAPASSSTIPLKGTARCGRRAGPGDPGPVGVGGIRRRWGPVGFKLWLQHQAAWGKGQGLDDGAPHASHGTGRR